LQLSLSLVYIQHSDFGQFSLELGATSAFYSGAAAAATRGREGVVAIGLGRNEGERR